MRVSTLLVVGAIGVSLAGVGQAETTFRATLSRDRVVPPNVPCCVQGFVVLILDGTTAYFGIHSENVVSPTGLAVYRGKVGTNGRLVLTLVSDGGEFTDLGNAMYVAQGKATVDPTTAAAIAAEPTGYYFNIVNAEYPSGAARGQLAGEGYDPFFFGSDLKGARQAPGPGDGDGIGEAAIRLKGGAVYYYLWTKAISAPTAARIHVGEPGVSGGYIADLVASGSGFTDLGGGTFAAVGQGSIVGTSYIMWMAARTEEYWFNVTNDEFPNGALRGQLAPMETHVILPIVSRAQGQAGSNWVTDLRVLNQADEDASILAEWYPSASGGLAGPAALENLTLAAGSQGTFNNVVGNVFGATGNGAMRLVSLVPIAGAARIYNDQRANPAIGGTFGQFAPGLSPAQPMTAGAVPLLSNRPVEEHADFRSNVGYFNPWPWSVATDVAFRLPDGSVLGSAHLTLAPFANVITGAFTLIPGVPPASQTQSDMFLTFTAAWPVFVYGSVIDNVTNDAVLALPVPFHATPD